MFSLHHSLLTPPDTFWNMGVFLCIVAIYTFFAIQEFNIILAVLLITFSFFLLHFYLEEKHIRSLFFSMEKYFIWYYIANFVLHTKLIITHCSPENPNKLTLMYANSSAKRKFNLANSEELDDLSEQIELQQVISSEEDPFLITQNNNNDPSK